MSQKQVPKATARPTTRAADVYVTPRYIKCVLRLTVLRITVGAFRPLADHHAKHNGDRYIAMITHVARILTISSAFSFTYWVTQVTANYQLINDALLLYNASSSLSFFHVTFTSDELHVLKVLTPSNETQLVRSFWLLLW